MRKLEKLIDGSSLLSEEKEKLKKIISVQAETIIDGLEKIISEDEDLNGIIVNFMKIRFIDNDLRQEKIYLEEITNQKKEELGIQI